MNDTLLHMDELSMDFNLEGVNVDPDEGNWGTLIEEIIKGNVIPVIGPGILMDGKDINQRVIDLLAQGQGIDSQPTSFSQVVFDPKFKQKEYIYPWLHKLVTTKSEYFVPSAVLKRILSIKQFPFVITTSFFPVVENAMREIWKGREVRIMAFSNDPSTTNEKGIGDLYQERDIKDPTVYYMFGRTCKTPHKFVVTDADMLSFCKSWLSDDKRPPILSKVLKNKYLLVFGSNYSDWLFRFIWYSINQDENSRTNPLVPSPGMVVEEKADQELLDFLNRVDTFTQKDPRHVIDMIERKLAEREEEIKSRKFKKPELNTDVFLSYSRADEQYATQLYEALTEKGLNVWYDRQKLQTGSDWLQEIENAIDTTKYFVQIVSPKSSNIGDEFHVYTQERKMALEHAEGFERDFFIPLVHSSVDFYNADMPRQMKMLHAAFFDGQSGFEAFAADMLEKINALNRQ